MDESRESCLAALLARGLVRVRQRAERAGVPKAQPDNEHQPDAVADHGVIAPADATTGPNSQGEQR